MNALIYAITKVIAVIGANLCAIWAVVEFIIYLVKDHAFNWWSVWSFIICVAVAFGSAIMILATAKKSLKKRSDRMGFSQKKSNFQDRLEEMRRAQESKN